MGTMTLTRYLFAVLLTGLLLVITPRGTGATTIRPRPQADLTTLTLTVAADAYVREASPTTNSGTNPQIWTDYDSSGGARVYSFLHITIPSLPGSIQSARLRLYSTDAADNGPHLRFVSCWDEATVTWNSKPAAAARIVADVGATPLNGWVEYDLTGLLTSAGTYDLGLFPDSQDAQGFQSRENVNKPQLVLVIQSPPTTPQPTITSNAKPYDAGLSEPFQYAPAPTGRTLNVLNYGATPGNAADDDGIAFKNAIQAAQAGDVIYVPDGVYNITTRSIRLKSGVSIRGQSRQNTKLIITLAPVTNNPDSNVFFAPQGTQNLQLSNFTISTSGGQSLHTPIRLGQGNPDTTNSEYLQVRRILVDNVLVEGYERFGISIENGFHIEVKNSVFQNSTAIGGGGQGYGVAIFFDNAANNWIHNNHAFGPNIRHAYLLAYRTHHNLISNNKAQQTASDAIDIHGEDEYSNEIAYNKIWDCNTANYAAGIGVGETPPSHEDSGEYNWIHHNEVYNCTFGLRVVNDTNYQYVEDNYFHDNASDGVRADLLPLHNLQLRRNRIEHNGADGIDLVNVTSACVSGNTITNNQDYGIRTNSGTTKYIITGNTLSGNIDGPVLLGSSDGIYR